MRILLIIMFLFGCHSAAENDLKVVGGQSPDRDHPASWSTVALVDSRGGHAFCSGSYIAKNLIVTAAHCIIDLEKDSFKIRFNPEASFPVTSFQTYRSTRKYGSNFDIAWVKFEGEAPSPYRPIEIWHDPTKLNLAEESEVAGFGFSDYPCRDETAACNTGRLYAAKSDQEYVSNIRLFSLLVTKSHSNSGPCFGDSGGPAFIRFHGRWYLTGTFVGWDRILVPEDPDTLCKSGEGLYTFVGDYAGWLEESSSSDISFDSQENPLRPPTEVEVQTLLDSQSFSSWCQRRDFDDPSWYTVQRIIRLASDYRAANDDPRLAKELFENCDIAESWVKRMIAANKELVLDASEQVDAQSWGRIEDIRPLLSLANAGIESLAISESSIRDLSPLLAFPSLRKLLIRNNLVGEGSPLDLSLFADLEDVSIQNSGNSIAYESLSRLTKLKSLSLSDLEIEELPELHSRLEDLNLNHVGLAKPWDLSFAKNLRSLSLTLTPVATLPDELPELTDLRFLGNNELKALPSQMPSLKTLAVSGTALSRIYLGRWKELQSVLISDHRRPISVGGLSDLHKLQYLFITRNFIEELEALIHLPLLEVLDISQNRLSSLPEFEGLPSLRELHAGFNRIAGIHALPPGLQELDLSGNPLRILPESFHLEDLRILSLTEIPGLSSVEALGEFPMLEKLDLRGNDISDIRGLLRYPNLRELILSSNRIEEIACLASLSQLTYLEVINNPIRSKVCPLANGRCRFELFSSLGGRSAPL